MATITPEEAQLLAAKLAGQQVQGLRDVGAFANKLGSMQDRAYRAMLPSAATVETAKDRGDHALSTALNAGMGIGPVSSLLGASSVLPQNPSAPGSAIRDDRPGAVTFAPTEGSPLGLSGAAQQRLKAADLGTEATPMQTPGVSVQAAPTLASQEKKSPAYGAGGMPGGSALMARLRAAQGQQIHSMEQERDLTGQLGMDKAGRVMAVADLNELEAQRQQREADREAAAQQQAADRFDAFMSKQQRMVDDLAASKTDPGRLLRNADTRTQFAFHLGAAINGGLAAMNGTNGNSSLDRMERLIAQDIKSQEEAIDNKKSAINAQNSALGQLISETGNRSLARQQLRVLNLEAAKTKIQADADRLGIPEIRTNAELMTNAIQQKIDAANTALAKEAVVAFQQQAAAAAAAHAAAEEKAYRRQKEMLELGLKQDELSIKAFEAGLDPKTGKPIPGAGKAAKEDNAAIIEATKRLNDDKIVSNKALINRLAGAIRDDGSIVGFDPASKFKVGVVKGLGFGLPSDTTASRFALSGPERIAHKDWETAALLFGKDITGTGGSDEQMQRIQAAFEGAKTTEERRQAIIDLKTALDERERNATAVLSDEQKAEFMRRLSRDGKKK